MIQFNTVEQLDHADNGLGAVPQLNRDAMNNIIQLSFSPTPK